jgi:hypothetical protein
MLGGERHRNMKHYVTHPTISRDDFVGKTLAMFSGGTEMRVTLYPSTPREPDGLYVLEWKDAILCSTSDPERMRQSEVGESLAQEIVDKIAVVPEDSALGRRGFHFVVYLPPLSEPESKTGQP